MRYKVFITSIYNNIYDVSDFYIEWVSSFQNILIKKHINTSAMNLSNPNKIIINVILSKNRIHKLFKQETLYYEV